MEYNEADFWCGMGMKNKNGYTLLEMLIVCALITIFAGLSYQFYIWHMVSVRRADAQLTLLKLSSALENYYLQHNTYSGATLKNIGIADKSSQAYYQMSFMLTDEGQSYEAKATPLRSQAEQDKACGSLTLTTDGKRSYQGNDPRAACW